MALESLVRWRRHASDSLFFSARCASVRAPRERRLLERESGIGVKKQKQRAHKSEPGKEGETECEKRKRQMSHTPRNARTRSYGNVPHAVAALGTAAYQLQLTVVGDRRKYAQPTRQDHGASVRKVSIPLSRLLFSRACSYAARTFSLERCWSRDDTLST